MNTSNEHLCYFKTEQIAKVGDIIATCRHGNCKILEVGNGELIVENIFTKEISAELTSDCDFLQ